MSVLVPEPIKKLIARLSDLPAIGPRHATRLAFYLAARGKNELQTLARDIHAAATVKLCARCFFVHQNPEALCNICNSGARNQCVIMLTEKETDLLSLESSGKFNGRYLLLGPIPRVGILDDMQKLRLESLKSFIQKECAGAATEIVLGFNPTSTGDFSASLIAKELQPYAKKISRLGRGLPTGGEIEFADEETLGGALETRR